MRQLTLVVCDDLFFWARIHAAARAAGSEVRRIADDQALEELLAAGAPGRVLVDLAARSVDAIAWAPRLRALDPAPQLVAFGSHMDVAAFERARQAGFDPVLARSKFVADLPLWVAAPR